MASPITEYLSDILTDIQTEFQNFRSGITYLVRVQDSHIIWLIGALLAVPYLRALVIPQILLLGFVIQLIEQIPRRNDISTKKRRNLKQKDQDELGSDPSSLEQLNFWNFEALLSRGTKAWIILFVYAGSCLIIVSVARDPQRRALLLDLAKRSPLGVFVAIDTYLQRLSNVGFPSQVTKILYLIRHNLLPLIVTYIVPAAVANFALLRSDSLYTGFDWRRIRPIIFSRTYMIGWIFALPFMYIYLNSTVWFAQSSAEIAALGGGSLQETIRHLVVGPLLTFYCLITGFYIIGHVVRDTKVKQLTVHAEQVKQMFQGTDISDKEVSNSTTGDRPSVEWFTMVLSSEEEFIRNRRELVAWIRRILPEFVMYHIRTPYGDIGAMVPSENTTVGSATISGGSGEEDIAITIWYA